MPLYFSLLHGRLDPDEAMNEWGTEGPTFGPLDAVQTTYGTVRLAFENHEVHLPLVDGLIHYDGVLYGDSCTFAATSADAVLPDEALATVHQREWLQRLELAGVAVPAGALADYHRAITIFTDALVELGGEPLASSARRALHRVVEAAR